LGGEASYAREAYEKRHQKKKWLGVHGFGVEPIQGAIYVVKRQFNGSNSLRALDD
uniref:Protein kinase domain-containing protein n=1 Tax=Haemonchus placei TaxID=6290 RepID=A0A0N4WEB8_HAEPC